MEESSYHPVEEPGGGEDEWHVGDHVDHGGPVYC